MKELGYKSGGFENKYFIAKRNGEHIDPKADYFVLRLDSDPHALVAIKSYIESVRKDNEKLAKDLEDRVSKYERSGDVSIEMDDETSLPRDFFEIELEWDSDGGLKDECVRKAISRILAISNYIYVKTRRGRAEELYFNGPLAKILHNELRLTGYLKEYGIFLNDKPSDGLNTIELVRKGDNFVLIPDGEKYPDGEFKLKLKRTKNKQADTIYRILVKKK